MFFQDSWSDEHSRLLADRFILMSSHLAQVVASGRLIDHEYCEIEKLTVNDKGRTKKTKDGRRKDEGQRADERKDEGPTKDE